GISQTVTGAGGLASQIQQLSDRVAIKLQSTVGGNLFIASIENSGPIMSEGEVIISDAYGMRMALNGTECGGIYCQNGGNGLVLLSKNGTVSMSTAFAALDIGTHPQSKAVGVICWGNLLPFSGNMYNLGGNGDGQRWKTIYSNNSLNTSDVRFKRDIAPLAAKWLLRQIEPIRYRLLEIEDAKGKLRFGLRANGGAGSVQDA
ncbi:MAG: tail fiber domain-containing protein, partial [Clostridia bacterium]